MREASWKVVSPALVRAFDVPWDRMGAFIGKLGNLQKQGLLGVSPGKGVALRYTSDLMYRMVFACELFEFGLSPADILDLVRWRWERHLSPIFADAAQAAAHERGSGDIVMYMADVRLMTGGWVDAFPKVDSCRLDQLTSHLERSLTQDERFIHPGMPSLRVLATNLTERLRKFHDGLNEFIDEQRAEPASEDAPAKRHVRKHRVLPEQRRRGASRHKK